MKVRDSGMPEESYWETFFEVDTILDRLQINSTINSLLEVGCGYGTFTIPAARKIKGKLFAFDIEQTMIELTRYKAEKAGATNIEFINRDILKEGFDLPPDSIEYIMLFNILHHDNPYEILKLANSVLAKKGKIGIIHWRTDIETPRGPDMSIRPSPEKCIEMARKVGFELYREPEILEPYHYGLIIAKP